MPGQECRSSTWCILLGRIQAGIIVSMCPQFKRCYRYTYESEDESIRETREKRQAEDNGLADEHLERTKPDLARFLKRDTRGLEFIGSVDVGVLAGLATTLGLLVEEDGRTTLGHEEMDDLDNTTEDEHDPEEPLPCEESLNGTTNDTSDTGTDTRGQDNKGQGVLLLLGSVQIGDKTESDTTASSRETTLF